MRKVLSVLFMTSFLALNSVCFGVEQEEGALPVVEPVVEKNSQQVQGTDMQKVWRDTPQNYDNVPILNNKDRKVNFFLKQPDAMLGTQ